MNDAQPHARQPRTAHRRPAALNPVRKWHHSAQCARQLWLKTRYFVFRAIICVCVSAGPHAPLPCSNNIAFFFRHDTTSPPCGLESGAQVLREPASPPARAIFYIPAVTGLGRLGGESKMRVQSAKRLFRIVRAYFCGHLGFTRVLERLSCLPAPLASAAATCQQGRSIGRPEDRLSL
jgi:hypothetical protein